jgi:hypothetical protein
MGPYEELTSTGRPGPSMARLLYRTIHTVAAARNFPPPEGHVRWDESAVQEAAHDFLAEDRAEKRLADLAVRAVDERSFERLLHTSVLNFHRDRSRRTDMGALVRRVTEVLRGNDVFSSTDGHPPRWYLTEGASEPSVVAPPRLASAASQEPDVTIPRWTSSRRRAPLADLDTFRRLCRRILEAARGSLTAVEIAHAVAARLDPGRVPLTLELDVLERLQGQAGEAGPENEVVGRVDASTLFEGLPDRERILLATWDRPVRDLSEVLGVGHSQANVLRQRLASRLGQELQQDEPQDQEEAEAMVTQLRSLATNWLRQRTPGSGSTS